MALPGSKVPKGKMKEIQFELNRGFLALAVITCGGTAMMPLWGRLLMAIMPWADPILLIATFIILTIPGVYSLFRIYLPIPLSEWLRGLREGKRETSINEIREKIKVKEQKKLEKAKEQAKFIEEKRKERIKEKGLTHVEREERQKARRLSKRRVKSASSVAGVLSKKEKKKRNPMFVQPEKIPEWHKTVLALDLDLVWKPTLFQVVGIAALFFVIIYGGFFLIDFIVTTAWQIPSFMGISVEKLQYFMTHPYSFDPETAHIYFDPEEYVNVKIALGLVQNPLFWFIVFFLAGFMVWLFIDEWIMALINQRKYQQAELKEIEKRKGLTD
ncbi:MAG: hypothetical protein ACXACA_05520 [Candidatus Ranarchaeia archaeon]|jgi:hypothetical protein